MGSLGHQLNRSRFEVTENQLDAFLKKAAELAKKYSINVRDVIEAKRSLELERQNNIKVQAGDFLDEQAGGLGEILERIAVGLESKE